MICNGEHAEPPCDDPQCWRRDNETHDMRLTVKWRRLREILIREVSEMHDEERGDLLGFIAEHWGSHAPRQTEFHALEHRMRQCEREIEIGRRRRDELRESMTYGEKK